MRKTQVVICGLTGLILVGAVVAQRSAGVTHRSAIPLSIKHQLVDAKWPLTVPKSAVFSSLDDFRGALIQIGSEIHQIDAVQFFVLDNRLRYSVYRAHTRDGQLVEFVENPQTVAMGRRIERLDDLNGYILGAEDTREILAEFASYGTNRSGMFTILEYGGLNLANGEFEIHSACGSGSGGLSDIAPLGPADGAEPAIDDDYSCASTATVQYCKLGVTCPTCGPMPGCACLGAGSSCPLVTEPGNCVGTCPIGMFCNGLGGGGCSCQSDGTVDGQTGGTTGGGTTGGGTTGGAGPGGPGGPGLPGGPNPGIWLDFQPCDDSFGWGSLGGGCGGVCVLC